MVDPQGHIMGCPLPPFTPAQHSEGLLAQPCPWHGRALTCSLLSLQEGEQVLPGSLLPYYCALQVPLGLAWGYSLGVAARLGLAGQDQSLELVPLLQVSVSCSDGAGRTGTYILIDMVLNRMAKGRCRAALLPPCSGGLQGHVLGLWPPLLAPFSPSAPGVKEIDIAATLEHIRDQRPGMVQTKVPPNWGSSPSLSTPPSAGLTWTLMSPLLHSPRTSLSSH